MKEKKWFIALLSITFVAIVILVFSFIVSKYYHNVSKDISSTISLMENSIEDKDWKKAINQYTQAKKKWESNKDYWAMLIDHLEIDNIDISLIRLEKYLKASDYTDALAETGVLFKYITHIPEKESGSLINIF